MIDLVDRHRALVMLGVVRTMVDVDDDPYELDEVSAAIVDALDAFDETRRKAPLRIPKGFEGGGRFRKISDRIFERLQEWARGDTDNPFEGDEFNREHLRKAAKERGITLRRGATFNEIANALLDDVRKGKGKDKDAAEPDAKPAKNAAPKKAPAKATPRAPAKKTATKAKARGDGTFDARVERGKKGDAALDAVVAGTERDRRGLTDSQHEAFADYKGLFFNLEVNEGLRGNRELKPETVARIRDMDTAMQASSLTDEIVVYRGIGEGPAVFGAQFDDDLTGVEVTDAAFMSTSTNEESAGGYSRWRGAPRPVVMRLVVPEGVGAVHISDAAEGRDELLLQRGLRLRVVRDRGEVDGTRRLDVEVVPTEPGDLPNASPKPDSVALARQRQADIDTARTYAHLAATLDELTANEASDATLLSRLEASVRRGDLPEAEVAPILAAVRARREVEVENRIRAAYRAHARGRIDPDLGRRKGFVPIADIRQELSDVPDEEITAALQRMAGERRPDGVMTNAVRLTPQEDQKRLTPADRAGAVRFGDTAHHWVSIDDPSDRPAPDARPLVAALLASRGITQDGAAGESGRFDPKVHQPIGGSIRQGAAVEVVRPGFTLTRPSDSALAREVEVENRVRAAFRALRGRTDLEEGGTEFSMMPGMTPQRLMRQGGYVSIADLRDEVGSDIPRAELDEALKRIAIHDPGANAVPESAQGSLTAHQRAGAIHFGDQDKHWLIIDDPSDRPLPRDGERIRLSKAVVEEAGEAPAADADPLTVSLRERVAETERLRVEREAALGPLQPGQVPDRGRMLSADLQSVVAERKRRTRPNHDWDLANGRGAKLGAPPDRIRSGVGFLDHEEVVAEVTENDDGTFHYRIYRWRGGETVEQGDGDLPTVMRRADRIFSSQRDEGMARSPGRRVRFDVRQADEKNKAGIRPWGVYEVDENGDERLLSESISQSRAEDKARELTEREAARVARDEPVPTEAPDPLSSLRTPAPEAARGPTLTDEMDAMGDAIAQQREIDIASGQRRDPVADTFAVLRDMDAEAARDALDLNTVPQLKDLIREVNARDGVKLPVSGRKRELVDRLVGHLHRQDTESLTDELIAIERRLAAGEISKAQAAKLRRAATRSDDMDAETRDRVLALAEMRFADEMRAMDDNADELRALALGDDEFEAYWTRGKGLRRWRFSAHPWTTLRNLLRQIRLKHGRGPRDPEGLATTYFHKVFGYYPGSDLHRVGSGKPPRGKRIGPG